MAQQDKESGEQHLALSGADGKKIAPADKVGGQRVPARPLSHSLSASLEATHELTPELEEAKKMLELTIAIAEKKVIQEENLVAATAKDLFGESSKAVASTYHPPAPQHERHDHAGGGSRHPISQPASRSAPRE